MTPEFWTLEAPPRTSPVFMARLLQQSGLETSEHCISVDGLTGLPVLKQTHDYHLDILRLSDDPALPSNVHWDYDPRHSRTKGERRAMGEIGRK